MNLPIIAGKRVFCPHCHRPRLVTVTANGGEIGANYEEGEECGLGAFEARVEYGNLVKRWVHRSRREAKPA